MVPVNLDLVREKAADIRGALDLLRDYGARPRKEFLADETMVSAAKYQVILAVEAAQALCNHLQDLELYLRELAGFLGESI